jgi:hypothetical protein
MLLDLWSTQARNGRTTFEGVPFPKQIRGRDIKTLWVIAGLGIAYGGLIYSYGPLTGSDEVDGIIGVVLGLYICSHPAAHLVDRLFFRRGVRRELSSGRAFLWFALNLLVMLIGWFAIFLGATRLVARGE